MPCPEANERMNARDTCLPWRDWILLPIISLATISVLAGSTELIARGMFTESGNIQKCLPNYIHTPGIRGIPHCVCWEKDRESLQGKETHFNRNGYVGDRDFGPKSPDVYRIVLVGSSVAMSLDVQNDRTHTAQLATELSGQTGHPVELFNQALPGPAGFPESAALRLDDALAAKPNLILWVITRSDINYVPDLPTASEALGNQRRSESTWHRVKGDLAVLSITKAESEFHHLALSLMSSVKSSFDESIAAFLLKHFLFESQSLYLKQTLRGSDDTVGYLKAQPSLKWQNALQGFDGKADEIISRANHAGVPLALVYVPNAGPAAMISNGHWPVEYDPYALGESIRTIVKRHGAIYVDILPDFRALPNPERNYLPVNGHPNVKGQVLLANLIARELTSVMIPKLQNTDPKQNQVKETK